MSKRIIVVCRGTYRGYQILESEGVFLLYIGTERHEFGGLPEATSFIDGWIEMKKN